MPQPKPTPCFDNVAFECEGRRIVGTVINYDDDGLLIVANPFLDNLWHVPVEEATITSEHITRAPDCE